MRKIVLILLFAAMLIGCKVVKPIANTRDSVRVEYRLDSIYLYERDSVYVDRYAKNDTIWVTTTKWQTRYKDVIKEVHDTITTKQTETLQVRYVPAFYKNCTWGFWIFIILIVIRIALWLIKKYYLHK